MTVTSGPKDVTQAGIVACSVALEKIKKQLAPFNKTNASEIGQLLRNVKLRLTYPFKHENVMHCKDMVLGVQQNLSTALQILEILSLVDTRLSDLQDEVANISMIARTLPNVVSSLEKIEANVSLLTPQSISPKAIDRDATDMQRASRRFERFTRNHAKTSCKCHGHSNTEILLQWPFRFSRTRKRIHSSHCPYSAIEDTITDLTLRFSMCSVALRRKAHVTIELSHAAWALSLVPSLEISRIVSWDSPAVKLIGDFEATIRANPGVETWRQPAQDLHKLFAQRKASPHDRFLDGSTLLHLFCAQLRTSWHDDGCYWTTNISHMARQLLDYMPREAFEKDDKGRLDVEDLMTPKPFVNSNYESIVVFSAKQSRRGLRVGEVGVVLSTRISVQERDTCVDIVLASENAILVEDLIEHGIGISSSIGLHIYGVKSLERAGIDITNIEESLLDIAGRTVFHKSEANLRDMVANKEYASNSEHDSYSLYEISTSIGWRRGCEILYENNIPVHVENNPTLLELAIQSSDFNVFKFWLDVRPELDGKSLEYVGTLEDSLDIVAEFYLTNDWIDMIISALIKQRTELQRLWDSQSSPLERLDPDRILEAHAQRVYETLRKRKVIVKPRLRPSRRSIYYQRFTSLEVLNALYSAGFHDVTAEDFVDPRISSLSPLFFLITSTKDDFQPPGLQAEVAEWYLGKGATLNEQWPGGHITLSSCLAWKLGFTGMCTSLEQEFGNFAYLIVEREADVCTCHCSTFGCLFVTFVVKGLGLFVEETVDNTPGNRWLITELIRLVIFSRLEIRHTCCDPNLIQHNACDQFH
ncbi:hypothetical protein K491DRAFT_675049 [Lophiostoma macrostomum CBS 122681]|uniref:Uncharacterized protein n=1 Tax=Lophiostoma macrostomum CBS 122681 TaxID=1314788 RepID=A0A6A6TJT9_9PLEO|nr:hypothetical protein K491DRAFT_675049 [Lophiostoma macrostomum CBS 122681]